MQYKLLKGKKETISYKNILTHVDPKLVPEEDEKEMDWNKLCEYNHHQFSYVYSGHKHLNQQLFLRKKPK